MGFEAQGQRARAEKGVQVAFMGAILAYYDMPIALAMLQGKGRRTPLFCHVEVASN